MLKKKIFDYGLPLVIIFIFWEVIEDIFIPYAFYLLGENVNEAFYAFIPASFFVCLHWITVPLTFFIYLKITGKNPQKKTKKKRLRSLNFIKIY